jgi:hypothetical protein
MVPPEVRSSSYMVNLTRQDYSPSLIEMNSQKEAPKRGESGLSN